MRRRRCERLLSFTSGTTSSGTSGEINVATGRATNGKGGDVLVSVGAGETTYTGGDIVMTAGLSTAVKRRHWWCSERDDGPWSLDIERCVHFADVGCWHGGRERRTELHIRHGVSGGNSGSISLFTGAATHGEGGDILVSVGKSRTDTGGDVYVIAGDSTPFTGGAVSLTTGEGTDTSSGSFIVRTVNAGADGCERQAELHIRHDEQWHERCHYNRHRPRDEWQGWQHGAERECWHDIRRRRH